MAAGNRPAPLPPPQDLLLPVNDPRPLFFVLPFPSAAPRGLQPSSCHPAPAGPRRPCPRPPVRALAPFPWGATRAVEKRNRGGKWRLGSAYLVFLARPRLSFSSPFPSSSLGPSHSALALTGGSVSPHALPASLSRGAPTTPHFFFLRFPPPPSSILSLPYPDADPGVIPCWCPRPSRRKSFLVRLPDFMSWLCLFSHCPIPALLCLHPAAWFMWASAYLVSFSVPQLPSLCSTLLRQNLPYFRNTLIH